MAGPDTSGNDTSRLDSGANRLAWVEEGSFGVAFRPITHDWFSALAKVSRRVDVRPLKVVLP